MNDIAIRVENLGKLYRVGQYVGYQTLRESLVNAFSAPFRRLRSGSKNEEPKSGSEYIWALKDASFEVKPGEAIGIIGRNGAGKTTLLRVLCRITEPTEGYAEIHGRVGSLLEVGTGFHPELTGRENVYLNGAVLGMKRKELDRKFDEITDFAGEAVRNFIDTPLKRYSTGMQVRLAFAVAAHLEPEILLVDEVLAVGDVAFQRKCLGKMDDVAKGGRTVLFVSHNMGMIKTLCERCILLESGRIIQDGESSQVISRYLTDISPDKGSEQSFTEDKSKNIQIRRVAVMDKDLNLKTQFDVFEQVTVEVEYEVREEMVGSLVTLNLSREGVELFQSWDTDHNQELLNKRLPGYYRARVNLPCPLKAGSYIISTMTGIAYREVIERIREALSFEVEEISSTLEFHGCGRQRPGFIAADLVWKTERVDG
ncbi:ABC transporter ATP-binding protein [Chloroflexota bacterium]